MQSIRNFFHTDTWWGKTIFIFLIYLLYWCLFYGTGLLIPDSDYNTEINAYFPPIYFLIIVPLISFIIPHFIKKIFIINNFLLYFIHVILVVISAAIFLLIAIVSALSNFHIG